MEIEEAGGYEKHLFIDTVGEKYDCGLC